MSSKLCEGCFWNRKMRGGGCIAFTKRYIKKCPGWCDKIAGKQVEKEIYDYHERVAGYDYKRKIQQHKNNDRWNIL